MERIRLHRIYSPASPPDGVRFLVDRLWPRGVKKEDLRMEAWLKEAAPSTELRQWFAHDPAKWDGFRKRYFAELDRHPEAWQSLIAAARRGPIVLLYSVKDEQLNNAVALKQYLEAKLKTGD